MRRGLMWVCGVVAWAATARGQTGMFAAGPGRHLYLHCEGERHGPVVVLEEGGGDEDTASWRLVQPEVAKFTEVCSYDREGQGRSTVDGITERVPQTVDEQVRELGELLRTAGVAGPFVMVGHSAGGVLVRRFATRNRSAVVGMVLVDSSHEEQTWRFQRIDPASVQGPPADPARVRAGGGTEPGQRLQWHDDIPLIVIEHGIPFQFDGSLRAHAAEFEAAMHAMQVDLASRSKYGQLWTAKKSGHDVMLDEPGLVVRAVRAVWTAAR